MKRKDVLAARRQLEDYYYACKLETPEEVARLFEVYTKLIWVYHLPGLVYDYYCDETLLNMQGSEKMIGGVDVTESHTIPSFSAFPNRTTTFMDIFCVGDPENGYRFGQVTTHAGVYSSNGFSALGRGTDLHFKNGEEFGFCQCMVNKVQGRWVVTEEFLGSGEDVSRRWKANSGPFDAIVPAAQPQEDPDATQCEK